MIALTFSLLSLIALSVGQNQTVSLLLPDADAQNLVGSIVGGDATATTYVVQCADGGFNGAAAITAAAATTAAATTAVAAATTDFGDDVGDACGFPFGVTIVEGPSTVAYSLALDDNTVSIGCVLSGSSVAVCTTSATFDFHSLESVALPTQATTTLSGSDLSYQPVVITAGSVTNTASTPASTTASTKGGAVGGSTTSSGGGTQAQTGSTTSASAQASGAAIHKGPAMGMGAAGALAVVAAVVL